MHLWLIFAFKFNSKRQTTVFKTVTTWSLHAARYSHFFFLHLISLKLNLIVKNTHSKHDIALILYTLRNFKHPIINYNNRISTRMNRINWIIFTFQRFQAKLRHVQTFDEQRNHLKNGRSYINALLIVEYGFFLRLFFHSGENHVDSEHRRFEQRDKRFDLFHRPGVHRIWQQSYWREIRRRRVPSRRSKLLLKAKKTR